MLNVTIQTVAVVDCPLIIHSHGNISTQIVYIRAVEYPVAVWLRNGHGNYA